MAKIDVTGWVQDWADGKPQPDWAMKFSETHSRKHDDGWKVESRTFWTVKTAWGVEIDFSQFKSGDRVRVVGSQVTEKSTGKDGKDYYNLVIRAEKIERVESMRAFDPDVPF
jgi:hypothetical protein